MNIIFIKKIYLIFFLFKELFKSFNRYFGIKKDWPPLPVTSLRRRPELERLSLDTHGDAHAATDTQGG